MLDNIEDYLKSVGLTAGNGELLLGIAVLASMGVEDGSRFTEREFIDAADAFTRGLLVVAPHIKF